MKVLMLVLTLALLPLQYGIAAAASYPVLYVRSNGLPGWPCGTSPSQACKSIATAVNNANAYATTTIRVAQGDYAEYISITENLPVPHSVPLSIEGGWSTDFTVQSHDPALTRITPAYVYPYVLFIHLNASQLVDLRLAYLTLHGTSDLHRKGIDAGAFSGSTINLVIEHCRLASFRGAALVLVGNYSSSLTFTLDDSTIEGNYQLPTDPWPTGGINATLLGNSTGDVTLRRNRIINNQAVANGGLYFKAGDASLAATLENNILAENQASGGGGGAISAETAGSGTMDLYLTNNTITKNTALIQGAGINFIASDNSSLAAYLKNTIVWEEGTDIFMQRFAGLNSINVTADYSIIGDVDNSSGSGGTYTAESSVLNTDPLLNAGYRLSGASPARDSGSCGIKLPPPFNFYIRTAPYDDIDGDSRPGYNTTLGCDIGADEYRFPWILFNPLFGK